MIVLISVAFAILGTVILRPQQLVPEGVNLLNYQASFLTTLSPLLLPLYQLAVFLAFFGSLYAAPEMGFRIFYEYLITLRSWRDRLPVSKLRWAVIFWLLGGGLSVLWLSRLFPSMGLIDIVTPAGHLLRRLGVRLLLSGERLDGLALPSPCPANAKLVADLKYLFRRDIRGDGPKGPLGLRSSPWCRCFCRVACGGYLSGFPNTVLVSSAGSISGLPKLIRGRRPRRHSCHT